MKEPELSRGEEIAVLLLALAAVRPGSDPRQVWCDYCEAWRSNCAEIAAEQPIDTEAPSL